ncbi:MAG: hypothetical protein K1Y02_02500 [Candidatus Hydrogenedentes bacterium]|nr:hypothetical protein [Candidatus Hydrogenedentota bacterium]
MTYALIGPWLALILIFLTLPFLRAVFKNLRMDEAKKRNHAIEHGTIYFLRKRVGKKARIGGRAFDSGFRLSGIKNKADVSAAFAQMIQALQEGNSNCVVANQCGSMTVTAQGLSVLLLTITWLLAAVIRFSFSLSAIVLAANICLFVVLRYVLGRWIQRRYLLSVNFASAEIVAIEHVKDRRFFEEPSTVFVKTRTSD